MHFLRKGRCRTKKRPIQKKGHCRTSPLENGLAKLPCFLKILASWGDFFDNGLLIYPFSDHTIQCCTQKPFWVAKLEPRSCSASAFPYFEADAELGVFGRKYVLEFFFWPFWWKVFVESFGGKLAIKLQIETSAMKFWLLPHRHFFSNLPLHKVE